jgi:hypothetical protein
MVHSEICESSCVTMKSKPVEASGYNLAIFSGDAQPWIKMPSSFSSDVKRTASSSRIAWHISASELTKKEAKAIGESAQRPQVSGR